MRLKAIASVQILVFLSLLCVCAVDVYSDEKHRIACGSLRDIRLKNPPKRVLLIPLLSKEPHTTESPRWSEQPAHALASFYRKQFNATVTQFKDVWFWTDYYRQAEQLMNQSQPFDRVIFISHGGFDGPVLANAKYLQEIQVAGDKSTFLLLSEAQPGLMNATSITYTTEKNRLFSDYIVSHQSDFASMKSPDIRQQLKGLEKQLQPLNTACFQRYCSSEKLSTLPADHHAYQLYLCERICREPLFELNISVEISPERFYHFTTSLNSLVTENGLIFFGACNPGSEAPKTNQEWDETELLINSNLANGPHQSYVHLISVVTGRIVSGPIGDSSAEDIVNRIIKLETHKHQHNLCLVLPETK